MLTIPLLSLRNLFTRGKQVTKNFVPGPEGGLTPLAMSNILYLEARTKCGVTKVYLIFDQWNRF